MSEPDRAAARTQPAERSRTSALVAVYVTVFLDLLGFGIILPSLPFFARDLGASGLALGMVLTAYSLTQFFGSPVFGRLSDRHGRRPILLLSLTGTMVSMLLCAWAPSLVLLAAARALAGFFGGSIGTAQAYIADRTRVEERPRFMGFLGAAIGLGFVLGPALGAAVVAAGYGFRESALMAAGLALITLVFAVLRLDESVRPGGSRPGRFSALRRAWTEEPLRAVLVSNFAVTAAFVVLETTFAYLGSDRFGMGAAGFGMTMFALGMVLVVVQGGLIGRLSARFGVARLALVGSLAIAVAMLGVPLSHSLAVMTLPLAVIAAGRGLATPSISVLASVLAEEEQGAILGVLQSMAAAARAVIPALAGWLYDLGQGFPYVAASVLAAVSLLLLWQVRGVDSRAAHQ